jgi:hypothetical protein
LRTESSGAALLEVVVAVACALLVVQLALSSLASARRAEADLRVRSERIGAERVSRMTLRRELRAGVAGRDWVVFAPDSLRVRGFRGRALVCPHSAGTTELVVSFDGLRRPEPTKDSLLVLDDAGTWTAVGLVAVASGPLVCPQAPTTPAERWEISLPTARPIVLVRLFEPVSYHLATSALRYRVGGGGREPLTPEALDTRRSVFTMDSSRAGIRLEAAGRRPWSWTAYLGGGG